MTPLENDFVKQFTYHISHDLKAPLRHMGEFHRLFIESMGEELTPKQQEFDGFFNVASEKLACQLDALQRLSRAVTLELHKEKFNLLAFLESLIVAFDKEHQSNINIECDSAIEVNTDPHFLTSALHEIIENAIKFRADDRDLVVTIQVVKSGQNISILVVDNGVGLPTKLGVDLFQPFQRCLNAKKKPGAGIGLTIVKFISDRLGGKIGITQNESNGVSVNLYVPDCCDGQ